MGRKGSIPWNEIKNDYVNGTEVEGKRTYPTLRELAEKYEIDLSGIGTRCKKEDWKSERQIVSNKIQTATKQKTIEQISDKGVDFDLKCFEDALLLRKKQRELMENIKPDDTYAIKKLLTLGQGLKIAQELAKEALGEGIVQDDQKITIEIVK
jgi:hypothetical protein